MSSRTKECLKALDLPHSVGHLPPKQKQTKKNMKRQYLFFLDVLNASCCGKSDIRILAVNSSISGMRVPRDKGRMPKMKRFQRTKGLSARAFEGPGSTQSQIDKMNEKADLHRHDRVQWHVNPKSCYSDPRRRSDTCRVMMRQWEAREGRKS